MNNKDIMRFSLTKNPSKTQQAFNSAVGIKILNSIEAKKAEVGVNLIRKPLEKK